MYSMRRHTTSRRSLGSRCEGAGLAASVELGRSPFKRLIMSLTLELLKDFSPAGENLWSVGDAAASAHLTGVTVSREPLATAVDGAVDALFLVGKFPDLQVHAGEAHLPALTYLLRNIDPEKAGEEVSSLVENEAGAQDGRMTLIGVYSLANEDAPAYKVMYKAGATIVGTCKKYSKAVKSAHVIFCSSSISASGACGFLEGIIHGGYKDTRFQAKKAISGTLPSGPVLSVMVGVPETASPALKETFADALTVALTGACGTVITKELVNAPPNVATPFQFAKVAELLAAKHASLDLTVYDREQCAAMKMGSYLSVAQGSAMPPYFIHLKYSHGTCATKIAFVGKTITMDTGGVNLKTGADSMIHLMKFDCGGGSAVLGAADIIAKRALQNIEIHFVLPACENAVDGNSYRPGDVILAMNNMSIEVVNTDAEGRLALADALAFADRLNPDYVVDIATLTGAAVIAMGPKYAAMLSNDQGLIKLLYSAGQSTGDFVWEMPLDREYAEVLKSDIADVKHTGQRAGGIMNAALFLEKFVQKGRKWAHLDIAPSAWDFKANVPTSFGAKLLAHFAEAAQAELESRNVSKS
ncbi:putative cytosol aminopeptidase [Porphyridium purpureum]|uniref:Putative cytosol aminopeptidase n=1 Tax=Porphyridium purpureum TaxID=35688 RepID=A0A5J4YWZ3_PORPP|nr:putative cytosol aminopeptidase [Porphyridium purpureum]|eukprot:POR5399..scf209_3